jgi:hypothetical protein
LITQLSRKFQENLVKERTKLSDPDKQNQFQPGDLVLFQMNVDNHLPYKLHPRFKGPYEVVSQYKNDVDCKDLIYGSIYKYHVGRLKLFHGSGTPEELRAEAFRLAQVDDNQYVMVAIHAYRGDIARRSSLEFEIEFADGDRKWLPYSNDIFQTQQYEAFCDQNTELFLLKYRTDVAKTIAKSVNAETITSVDVGTKVYVNLRQYGCAWFESLDLPDFEHTKYVILFEYTEWKSDTHKKIRITSELTLDSWMVANLWIRQFGTTTVFDPLTMHLVDEKFLLEHPNILGETHRQEVLARCRANASIEA